MPFPGPGPPLTMVPNQNDSRFTDYRSIPVEEAEDPSMFEVATNEEIHSKELDVVRKPGSSQVGGVIYTSSPPSDAT